MPPVTAGNNHLPAESDEPEFPTLEEVLSSVEEALEKYEREHPHLKVDPDTREAIRASMRVDIPRALTLKKQRDFWRWFARRHGLRAAERLTFISRFNILKFIGGLEDNLKVCGCMQDATARAIEFDEEADQKMVKNGSARRP